MKMKKIVTILCVLSMAIYWNIESMAIYPADFVIDGVRYNILDKEARTVQTSGFDGYQEEVVHIPAHVVYDGTEYTVTKFGENNDGEYYNPIPKYGERARPNIIYLPATITEIAKIDYRSDVAEFYMADTALEKINDNFCRNNEYITSISLPHGIKTIDYEAFNCCPHLTTIKGGFPESLEFISTDAFSGENKFPHDIYMPSKNNLEEIILPNSLKTLGSGAFAYSGNANQIVLPNNLNYIPEEAFLYCDKVRKLVIPNNVYQIGSRAFFSYDKNLESLTIGRNVGYVADDAFTKIYNNSHTINLKVLYWLTSEENAEGFDYSVFNKDAKVMVPPGKREAFENLEGWKDWFHDFQELPEIFFQFQQDYYNLDEIGESMALRYQVTSFIDNPNYEIEWISSNPNGVVVENDSVKGLKRGVYAITACVKDLSEQGKVIMKATCNVGIIDKVDAEHTSVDEIFESTNQASLPDGIYNLQGIRLESDINNLPQGLYIVVETQKARKVKI